MTTPGRLLNLMYGKKPSYKRSEVISAMTAYLKSAENIGEEVEVSESEKEITNKYNLFLVWFNKNLNRDGKYMRPKSVIYQKVKNMFIQRIKEGYVGEDMRKVLANILNDNHHKDTNYKYVTPEFMLRSGVFERFLVIEHKPVEAKYEKLYADEEGRDIYTDKEGNHFFFKADKTRVFVNTAPRKG